jgi:6-phosphofructokinase
MKKALVYFQSGGPTSVINSSLYGVIVEAKKHLDDIDAIYGAKYGVEGLLDDNLINLSSLSKEEIELLKQTPGAILGSSRHKVSDSDFALIDKTIATHNIGYLLVNGGNDSMDTCMKLARHFSLTRQGVRVIGIPKTIDNDLVVTDHSIGYPSASLHIINSLKSIILDARAYKKGKVVLVEIMGRDTGWLTASSDMLEGEDRPDFILLPETPFNEEEFLNSIKSVYSTKGYCVVALSEGISFHHESLEKKDAFGHAPLEGVSLALGRLIREKLSLGVRAIELSTPTRSDPLLISKVDQKEAINVGRYAVKDALKGETGKMVTLLRVSNHPYHIAYSLTPLESIADKEKKFPKEWIISSRELSPEFHDYLEPLLVSKNKTKMNKIVYSSSKITNSSNREENKF